MIEPRHSGLLHRDWLSLSTVNAFGKLGSRSISNFALRDISFRTPVMLGSPQALLMNNQVSPCNKPDGSLYIQYVIHAFLAMSVSQYALYSTSYRRSTLKAPLQCECSAQELHKTLALCCPIPVLLVLGRIPEQKRFSLDRLVILNTSTPHFKGLPPIHLR
jgi:hypothetical protein